MTVASFHIEAEGSDCILYLSGHWLSGSAPDGDTICSSLITCAREAGSTSTPYKQIQVSAQELDDWDSSLASALLHLARWCEQQNIILNIQETPTGLQQLLGLARTAPVYKTTNLHGNLSLTTRLNQKIEDHWQQLLNTLGFVGEICIALGRWLTGKAKTRRSDIAFFVEQAGPNALPIVTLISLLVGMILAYLGSVQLRQLGAQVYVADLVSVGMVREMGALMTGVIMAGRTGAAYAAQLGTMQVNDEIDALKVMGVSSIDFLVLPRLLALIFVMPLLCIYADIIGMAGGALVAISMDVSVTQYTLQTQGAVEWMDIGTGLFKSLVFGILIAISGCQAGLQCGRNSNAVGMAATAAVVKAIVYLVVADAAFNILYDKLGI